VRRGDRSDSRVARNLTSDEIERKIVRGGAVIDLAGGAIVRGAALRGRTGGPLVRGAR